MEENNSCKDCRAHSGMIHDILHFQETTKNQQAEINDMKRWLIGTLTSSILSLIGVVVLLAITYARTL